MLNLCYLCRAVLVALLIAQGSEAFMSFFPKSLLSSRGGAGAKQFSDGPTIDIDASSLPSWQDLAAKLRSSPTVNEMKKQEALLEQGEGLPHTDAKIRLFGTTGEPRVVLYRDKAAWCPYCQKVWILLEEKRIPYKIEKINMRCYGDKPPEFLRLVPGGGIPAVIIDGRVQTESLPIMMNLEKTFQGSKFVQMWPSETDTEGVARANKLMRLEREIFGAWWGLVFRSSFGGNAKRIFEETMDAVNAELEVEKDSPWFMKEFSLVDANFIPMIERMCASVTYWSALQVRGSGRWPALERWLNAFELRPSYLATKADYYTHVNDLPPQCGSPHTQPGYEAMAREIDGSDGKSWKLPLPPLSPSALEPIIPELDPGDVAARQEAAYKLIKNGAAVARFALRGAGSPGERQVSAPLADPYAKPAEEFIPSMDACLRLIALALIDGYETVSPLSAFTATPNSAEASSIVSAPRAALAVSTAYLRDRVGVPRDMTFPAARQLRAHLNWLIDQL